LSEADYFKPRQTLSLTQTVSIGFILRFLWIAWTSENTWDLLRQWSNERGLFTPLELQH